MSKWGRFLRVREGRCEPPLDEIKDKPQNIALVDLSSAMVLVRKLWTPHPDNFDDGLEKIGSKQPVVRVVGSGLVFFKRSERVYSVVSLQKQFRKINDVQAYTADGIEMKAMIYLLFSIYQEPAVVQVAYRNNEESSLSVIHIDKHTNMVADIRDELDDADQDEIIEWIKKIQDYTLVHDAPLIFDQPNIDRPPYIIDEERIFKAVFSQADRINGSNSVSDWTDYSIQVAVEIYRDILSQWTLDALYEVENPEVYPIKDCLLPAFRTAMRNQGVLSFQYIKMKKGKPVAVGDLVDDKNYLIYEPVEFTSSKPLRDCGIKVVLAGFAGFQPVNPELVSRRLDYWQSRWQRRAALNLSDYDKESILIRDRSKFAAQRELLQTLSGILADEQNSKQALTFHFIQSLENLASDPSTRKFISLSTLRTLQEINNQIQYTGDNLFSPYLEDQP